jgi:hypothetical protein
MNEKMLDLVAQIQVKYKLTKDSSLEPVLKDLVKLTAKECLNLCEERVKAFDVAGNEYNVIRNHTQELCVKALKEQFNI